MGDGGIRLSASDLEMVVARLHAAENMIMALSQAIGLEDAALQRWREAVRTIPVDTEAVMGASLDLLERTARGRAAPDGAGD